MSKITTVGLDLAKNHFHLVGCNGQGKMIQRKALKRREVLQYFANLPVCLVGMEACSGAHYWGRALTELGHQVKLIAPQYVKAFLRGNKNDFNDALAIAEAVTRPQMRSVAIKTVAQQDQLLLHTQRQQCIRSRTAQANQIRAMLTEQGIVFRPGMAALRREVAAMLKDPPESLGALFIRLLGRAFERLGQLDAEIAWYDHQLKVIHMQTPACQQLTSIPGFGPVVASVFYSHVGNASSYHRGRDVAASIGLVPRQHSSGGKAVLLGISKRGNKQLRCLLIHGARAVVSRIGDKSDPISRWLRALIQRVGIHKATVAYANKMARMGWAVLKNDTCYQPHYRPTPYRALSQPGTGA